MQYLVQCKDKSMCLLYSRQVIVTHVNVSLEIGDSVQFVWPADSTKPKKYTGLILAKDRDEDVLLAMLESLVESQQPDKTESNKSKKNADTAVGSCQSQTVNIKVKGKKVPQKLLENEILDELKRATHTQNENVQLQNLNMPNLEFSNLKSEIITEICSFQKRILTKLDFFQTNMKVRHEITESDTVSNADVNFLSSSFSSNDILQEQSQFLTKIITKKRRSHGLPEAMDDCVNIILQDEIHESSSSKIEAAPFTKKRSRSYGFYDFTNDNHHDLNEKAINSRKGDDSDYSLKPNEEFDILNELDSEEFTTSQPSAKERKNSINLNLSDNDHDLYVPGKAKKKGNKIKRHHVIYSSEEDEEIITKKKKENEVNIKPEGEKSTSWTTLRYPTPAENVTELQRDSGIFVNNFELKKAVDITKNQTELARALMKCVFTEDALKKCSLTGKQSKGLGKTPIIRPGLDEKGVDAILMFVQRYAKKMNWTPKERGTIIRSMGAKLTEMKSS